MIFFSFKMSDVLATTSFTKKVYNMMFQFLLKKKKNDVSISNYNKNKNKKQNKKYIRNLFITLFMLY